MANLYSIDVRLTATAYIVADSEAEAFKIARGAFDNTGGELPTGEADVTVDGGTYSADMPEVSLSPAVTFDAFADDASVTFEEELEEDEQDDDCRSCAEATETRVAPCEECGTVDEDEEGEVSLGVCPYRPELVEAFRLGARGFLHTLAPLQDKIEVRDDATVRECDGDGVLVECWLYLHDTERPLMPAEREG